MDELLGADGTTGDLKAQLTKITEALDEKTGIKKAVDDLVKANTAATLNVKDKYTAIKDAVTEANKAIEEKLDSGDLTQLDTSNLKALKSSINDIQSQLESAFEDVSLDPDSTNNTNVPVDKLKKLQETLVGGVLESNTELGEKAVGVATSSQKQAETIAEMRNYAESVVHSLKTLRVLYKDTHNTNSNFYS